jgi:hypothetical protein
VRLSLFGTVTLERPRGKGARGTAEGVGRSKLKPESDLSSAPAHTVFPNFRGCRKKEDSSKGPKPEDQSFVQGRCAASGFGPESWRFAGTH